MRVSFVSALLIITMCIGASLSAVTIPLKSSRITTTINKVAVTADQILYAAGKLSNIEAVGQQPNVIFDVNSNKNYVLAKCAKFGETFVVAENKAACTAPPAAIPSVAAPTQVADTDAGPTDALDGRAKLIGKHTSSFFLPLLVSKGRWVTANSNPAMLSSLQRV